MRLALLFPVLALVACGSPCERVNAAQDDPAMQTCVFSAELAEDGTGSFSTDDGAPLAFTFPKRASLPDALPDGSQIHGRDWFAPGETPPADADSTREVASAALAPDGDRYALGMQWGHAVRLHSADGLRQSVVHVAEGEDPFAVRLGLSGWHNRAEHLAFAQGGATLVGSDTRRTVTAWDAETGAERWSLVLPEDKSTTGIQDLSVSPDGSRLAAVTSRAVHLLDAASGQGVARWALPGFISQAEWTPDGQYLAAKKAERWIPPTNDSQNRRVGGYDVAARVYLLRVPS